MATKVIKNQTQDDKKKKKKRIAIVAAASTAAGLAIAGTTIGLISSTNNDSSFVIAQEMNNNIPLLKLSNSPNLSVANAAKALGAMSAYNIEHAVKNNNSSVIGDLKTIIAYQNRNVKGFNPKDIIIDKNSISISPVTGKLEFSPEYGLPIGTKTKIGVITNTLSDQTVASQVITSLDLAQLAESENTEVAKEATYLAEFSPYSIVNLMNNRDFRGYDANHDKVLKALHILINYVNAQNNNSNYNPDKLHISLITAQNSDLSNIKNYQNVLVNPQTGLLQINATYGSNGHLSLVPTGTVTGLFSDQAVAKQVDTTIYLKNYLTEWYKQHPKYLAVYHAAVLLSGMTAWNIHNVLNNENNPNYLPVYNAVITLLRVLNEESGLKNFNPNKIHVDLPIAQTGLNQYDLSAGGVGSLNNQAVLQFTVSYGAPYGIPKSDQEQYETTLGGNWIPCKLGTMYNTYTGKELASSYQTKNGRLTNTPEINAGINLAGTSLKGYSPYRIEKVLNNKNSTEYQLVWPVIKRLINQLNSSNPQYNKNLLTGANASINAHGQLVLTPIYKTTNVDVKTGTTKVTLEDVNGLPAVVTGTASDAFVAGEINVGTIDASKNDVLKKMTAIAIANAVNNLNNPNHNAVVNALKNLIDEQNVGVNDNFNPEKLQLPKGSVSFNTTTGQLEVHPSYGLGNNLTPTKQIGTIINTLDNSGVAENIISNLDLSNLKYNTNKNVADAAKALAKMSAHEIKTIYDAGDIPTNKEYKTVKADLKTLLDYVNEYGKDSANFNPLKLNIGTLGINANGTLTITPTYGFENVPGSSVATCPLGRVDGTLADSIVANDVNSNFDIGSFKNSNNPAVKTAVDTLENLTPTGIVNAVKNANATNHKAVMDALQTLTKQANLENKKINPNKIHILSDSVSVNANGKLVLTPYYGSGTDEQQWTKCLKTPNVVSGTYSDQDMATKHIIDSINLENDAIKFKNNPEVLKAIDALKSMSDGAMINAVNNELKEKAIDPNAETSTVDNIIKVLDALNEHSDNTWLNDNFNSKKLHLTFGSLTIDKGTLKLQSYYGLPYTLSKTLKPNVKPGTITGTTLSSQVAKTLNADLDLKKLQIDTPTNVYKAAKALSQMSAYQLNNAYSGKLGKQLKLEVRTDLKILLDYKNQSKPNFDKDQLKLTDNSLVDNNGVLSLSPVYGPEATPVPTGTIINTLDNQAVANSINSTLQIPTTSPLAKMSPVAIKNAIDDSLAPNHKSVLDDLKSLINQDNQSNANFNPNKLRLPAGSLTINPNTGSLEINPSYGFKNIVKSDKTISVSGTFSDDKVATNVENSFNLNKILAEFKSNPAVYNAAEKLSTMSATDILNTYNQEVIALTKNPSAKTPILNDVLTILKAVNKQSSDKTFAANFNPDKLHLIANSLGYNKTTGDLTVQSYYGLPYNNNQINSLTPNTKLGEVSGTLGNSTIAKNIDSNLDLQALESANSSSVIKDAKALSQMSPTQIVNAFNGKYGPEEQKNVSSELKNLLGYVNEHNPKVSKDFNIDKLNLPAGCLNYNPKTNSFTITPTYGLPAASATECPQGNITNALSNQAVANSINAGFNIKTLLSKVKDAKALEPFAKLLESKSPIQIVNAVNNPDSSDNAEIVNALKQLIYANNPDNRNLNEAKIQLEPNSVTVSGDGQINVTPSYGSNLADAKTSDKSWTESGFETDAKVAEGLKLNINFKQLASELKDSKDTVLVNAIKTLSQESSYNIQQSYKQEINNPNGPQTVVNGLKAIVDYLNNSKGSAVNNSKIHFALNSLKINYDNGTFTLDPYYGSSFNSQKDVDGNVSQSVIGQITNNRPDEEVAKNLTANIKLDSLTENKNVGTIAQKLETMSPYAIKQEFDNSQTQKTIKKELEQLASAVYNNKQSVDYNPNFNPNKIITTNVTINSDGQLVISYNYGFKLKGKNYPCKNVILENTLPDSQVASKISASGLEIPSSSPLSSLTPHAIANAINNSNDPNHSEVVKALKQLVASQYNNPKDSKTYNPNLNSNKIQFPKGSVSVNPTTGKLEVTPYYGSTDNPKNWYQGNSPTSPVSGTYSDQNMANSLNDSFDLNSVINKYKSDPSVVSAAEALEKQSAKNLVTLVNKELEAKLANPNASTPYLDDLKTILDKLNKNTDNKQFNANFNPNKLHLTFGSLTDDNGVLKLTPYYGLPYTLSKDLKPNAKQGTITGTLSTASVAQGLTADLDLKTLATDKNYSSEVNAAAKQLMKMSAYHIQNAFNKTINASSKINEEQYNEVSKDLKILLDQVNSSDPNFDSSQLNLPANSVIDDNGILKLIPTYGSSNTPIKEGTAKYTLDGQGIVNGLNLTFNVRTLANEFKHDRALQNAVKGIIGDSISPGFENISPHRFVYIMSLWNTNSYKPLFKQLVKMIECNNITDYNFNPKNFVLDPNSCQVAGNGKVSIRGSYIWANENYTSDRIGEISGLKSDQTIVANCTITAPQINAQAVSALEGMSPIAIQNAVKNPNNPHHDAVVNAIIQQIIETSTSGETINPSKIHLLPNAIKITASGVWYTPVYGSDNVPILNANQFDNGDSNIEAGASIINTVSDKTVASQVVVGFDLKNFINNHNDALEQKATYLSQMQASQIAEIINDGPSNLEFKTVTSDLKDLIDNLPKNLNNPNFNPNKLQILKGDASVNAKGELEITPKYGLSKDPSNLATCNKGEVTGTAIPVNIAPEIVTNIDVSQDSPLNTLSPQGIVNIINNPGNKEYDPVINALKDAIEKATNIGSFNKSSLTFPKDSCSVNPVTGQLEIQPLYNNDKTNLGTVTGTLSDNKTALKINTSFDLENIIQEARQVNNQTVLTAAETLSQMSAYNIKNSFTNELANLLLKPTIKNYLLDILDFINKDNIDFNSNKLHLVEKSLNIDYTNGTFTINPYYGLPYNPEDINQQPNCGVSTTRGVISHTLSDKTLAEDKTNQYYLKDNINLSQAEYYQSTVGKIVVSTVAQQLAKMSAYAIWEAYNGHDSKLSSKTLLADLNAILIQTYTDKASSSYNPNFNPKKLIIKNLTYSDGVLKINFNYGFDLENKNFTCQPAEIQGTLSDQAVADSMNQPINVTNNDTLKKMSPYAIYHAVKANDKSVIDALEQAIKNTYKNSNVDPNAIKITPSSVQLNNGTLSVAPSYGTATSNAPSEPVIGAETDSEVAKQVNTNISIPKDSPYASMSPYHLEQILSNGSVRNANKLINSLEQWLKAANKNSNVNPDKIHVSYNSLQVNPKTGQLEISPTYGSLSDQTPCNQGVVSNTKSYENVSVTADLNLDNLKTILSDSSVSAAANALAKKTAYQIANDFNTNDSEKATDVNDLLTLLKYVNTMKNPNFNPNFIHVDSLSFNKTTGQLEIKVSYYPSDEKVRLVDGIVLNTLAPTAIAKQINIPSDIDSNSILKEYTPIGIQREVEKGTNTQLIDALKNLIANANKKLKGFNINALKIGKNSIELSPTGGIIIHPEYGYDGNYSPVNTNNTVTLGMMTDPEFVNSTAAMNQVILNIDVKNYLNSSDKITIGSKEYSVQAAAEAFSKIAPINILNQIAAELANDSLTPTYLTYYKVLLAEVNKNNINFNINKVNLSTLTSNLYINQTTGNLEIVPLYGLSSIENLTSFKTTNKIDGTGAITGTLPYKDVNIVKNIDLSQIIKDTMISNPEVWAMAKLLQSAPDDYLVNQLNQKNSQVLKAFKIVFNYVNRNANPNNPNFYENAVNNIEGAWKASNNDVVFGLYYGYEQDTQEVTNITISNTLDTEISKIQTALNVGISNPDFKNFTPYSLALMQNFKRYNKFINTAILNILKPLGYNSSIIGLEPDINNLNLTSTTLGLDFSLILGTNGFNNEVNDINFKTLAKGFTSQEDFMNIVTKEIGDYITKNGLWINGDISTNSGSYYLWLPNYYGNLRNAYQNAYVSPLSDPSKYPKNLIFATNWNTHFSANAASFNEAQTQINQEATTASLNQITNSYGFANELHNSGFISINAANPDQGTANYHNLQYVTIDGTDFVLHLNFDALINGPQGISINSSQLNNWHKQVDNVPIQQEIMKFTQINKDNINQYLFKNLTSTGIHPVQPSDNGSDWVQGFQNWVPFRELWGFNPNTNKMQLYGYRLIADGQEFDYELPKNTLIGKHPVVYANGFANWTSKGNVSITNISGISFGSITTGNYIVNNSGTKLTQLTFKVDTKLKFIGDDAFRLVMGLKGKIIGNNKVQSPLIAIPESVESIGNNAFQMVRQYYSGYIPYNYPTASLAYINTAGNYPGSWYNQSSVPGNYKNAVYTSICFAGGGKNLTFIGLNAFNPKIADKLAFAMPDGILVNNKAWEPASDNSSSYNYKYNSEYGRIYDNSPVNPRRYYFNQDVLPPLYQYTNESKYNATTTDYWANWMGYISVPNQNVYAGAFSGADYQSDNLDWNITGNVAPEYSHNYNYYLNPGATKNMIAWENFWSNNPSSQVTLSNGAYLNIANRVAFPYEIFGF